MQDSYVGDIGDDGKYTDYLTAPHLYRAYDTALFDALREIVCEKGHRAIETIQQARLFRATYFSKEIAADRSRWHRDALERTVGSDVIFPDPDNGLATRHRQQAEAATKKHVRRSELRDYYAQGQNVILYQHRPQMMKKEQCLANVMAFQWERLKADAVMLLEFPKYTNRFYFMFLHKAYKEAFQRVCSAMTSKWSHREFCREIVLE